MQYTKSRKAYKTWIPIVGLLISLIIGLLSSYYPKMSLYAISAMVLTSVISFAFIVKTEKTMKFLTTILLVGLFMVPGFSVGNIGLRIDDFITVPLTLFLVYLLFRDIESIDTPINKFIFFYITYVLLITITQITINDLDGIYIFFAIKEFQYLVYFFTFVYIMKFEWFRINFKKMFLWLSAATMMWVVYQLIFDANAGFYGTGLISESGSSQSGGVFFLISMFFLYMININQKLKLRVIYFILFLASAGMLFTTISRTAILAFTITYCVYLLFVLFRLSALRVLIFTYTMVIASPFIYFLIKDEIERIIYRMSAVADGSSGRVAKWEYLLSYVSDMGMVFGEGRGFAQTMTGGLTLGTDSQYVRNIMELGYIGSALFLLLITSILIFALKNMKRFYGESLFIILITCGFMIMSVTHEVYLVTIQASFFWMLIGAFVGKIVHTNKENLKSIS